MRILGIIPARLAATRFPNKPLAKIQGIPMIGHCYLRSKVCTLLDELYVATCDKEIVEYIECIGGKVILTSNKHERASERCVEALKNIEDNKGKEIFDTHNVGAITLEDPRAFTCIPVESGKIKIRMLGEGVGARIMN